MYRNVHSIRTGLDPVQTKLISVVLMHWLYSVLQLHNHSLEHIKRPASAAVHIFPTFGVEAEGVERDQCVVR